MRIFPADAARGASDSRTDLRGKEQSRRGQEGLRPLPEDEPAFQGNQVTQNGQNDPEAIQKEGAGPLIHIILLRRSQLSETIGPDFMISLRCQIPAHCGFKQSGTAVTSKASRCLLVASDRRLCSNTRRSCEFSCEPFFRFHRLLNVQAAFPARSEKGMNRWHIINRIM